jgi:hypothetical protein
MNNLLNNNFSTSVPLVSVLASIFHMIYGIMGLYVLAITCLIIPAIIFFCVAGYIFFQYGRYATIEVDLDTIQLGLIQLATILAAINSFLLIFTP